MSRFCRLDKIINRIVELYKTFSEFIWWLWYMIIAGAIPAILPVIAKIMLGVKIDFSGLLPDYYLIVYAILVNICSYRLKNKDKGNSLFETFHKIAVILATSTLFFYYIFFNNGIFNPKIQELINNSPHLIKSYNVIITVAWILLSGITLVLYMAEYKNEKLMTCDVKDEQTSDQEEDDEILPKKETCDCNIEEEPKEKDK